MIVVSALEHRADENGYQRRKQQGMGHATMAPQRAVRHAHVKADRVDIRQHRAGDACAPETPIPSRFRAARLAYGCSYERVGKKTRHLWIVDCPGSPAAELSSFVVYYRGW